MTEKKYKTLYLPDDLAKRLGDVVQSINETAPTPKHTTGPSELAELALLAFLNQGEPSVRAALARHRQRGFEVEVPHESARAAVEASDEAEKKAPPGIRTKKRGA